MTLTEAIEILRKKIAHNTREYNEADQALDLIAKHIRDNTVPWVESK